MWKAYSGIIRRYPRIPLSEERRLIFEAQKGSRLRQGFGGQARKSKDEIVLRHVGFIIDYLKKEINESKRIRHQLLQEIGI